MGDDRVEKLSVLVDAQQQLLQEWLRAKDGETRFMILQRLRRIEEEIGEHTKTMHPKQKRVEVFSIQQHGVTTGA